MDVSDWCVSNIEERRIFHQVTVNRFAQSAGSVEYTVSFFADGLNPYFNECLVALSVGSVEYTDCFSAER